MHKLGTIYSLGLGLTLTLGLGLTGCLGMSMDQEVGTPPALETNDPRFHARLQELAAAYEAYGRVDDELRWAPGLCREPMPSKPRFSQSADDNTHGKKLYFVFAADREAYLAREGKRPDGVGQVVVKEAWAADEVPAGTQYDMRASPVRYVLKEGHLYHAERKAGLFLMYRVAPGTEGTDDGWVYGTLGADGKTVTSSGRVGSCMGCHTKATSGRLFGIVYQGA